MSKRDDPGRVSHSKIGGPRQGPDRFRNRLFRGFHPRLLLGRPSGAQGAGRPVAAGIRQPVKSFRTGVRGTSLLQKGFPLILPFLKQNRVGHGPT